MAKYYHYTSIENWKEIKKKGLIKYPLKQIGRCVEGIFLWKNKLKGKAHAGAIIYQMGTKNSEKIVLLEISCEKKGFEADKDYGKYKKGDTISIDHDGEIGNLNYHNKEKGEIYFRNILVKNIKILKIYKLKNAFK